MNKNTTLYRERFRPQYHFTAPRGWLNDPNGLIFYRGEYHLFYQYNPHDIAWGAPYWGHAVSADMINWRHLPVALEPDALGSIFSGTIVADDHNTSGLFGKDGGLVALFTHHADDGTEYQSLAYSADCGRSFVKYSGNPVIRGNRGPEWRDFRDPKVLRFNNEWLMITGGGTYRFFRSTNLIDWHFVSDMAVFEEFPDLFKLGDQWILNVNGYGYYAGLLTAKGFTPTQGIRPEDFANSWQACYSYENMPDSRCVWLAWMRDAAKGPTDPWRCNMSIPRELTAVKEAGETRVCQQPVKEVETLRTSCTAFWEMPIEVCDLSTIRGQCLDIEVDFEIRCDIPFGIRCMEKDGRYAEIGCRPGENLIYADTRLASAEEFDAVATMFPSVMSAIGNQTRVLAKLHTTFRKASKRLRMRILLDVSVIEVFFDDGQAVCSLNVYPDQHADSISLFGKGQFVHSIRIHRMKSIWTENF